MEEYGFDRVLMMNLVIIDNTNTFNTDGNLVNIHFNDGNSSAHPQDEAGKWVHAEGQNRYEGLLLAQAKFDQLRLHEVTIGTGSAGSITRADIKVNRLFRTEKSCVNHLGTLMITMDDKRKSGVEYGYKTIVRTSDVFVKIQFAKPAEAILEENLSALEKYYPGVYKTIGNSVNKYY